MTPGYIVAFFAVFVAGLVIGSKLTETDEEKK